MLAALPDVIAQTIGDLILNGVSINGEVEQDILTNADGSSYNQPEDNDPINYSSFVFDGEELFEWFWEFGNFELNEIDLTDREIFEIAANRDQQFGLENGDYALIPISATVRDGRIILTPDDTRGWGIPSYDIPNNVGTDGYREGTHDYYVDVLGPPELVGVEGLRYVAAELQDNPTPGDDRPDSRDGTRNDVGPLVWGDGGD